MSTWSEALQVLGNAEAELRRLIERSLGQRKYDEVTDLARLADAVSQVVSLNNPEAPETQGSIPETASSAALVAPKLLTARRRQKGASRTTGFPRFEREGDWLIKIGWSKRERTEYEHRAPRHVIHVLIAAIRAKRGEGSRFAAADIWPLKESARREIPSYQAYLALAWLRQEGIIIKEGRDKYSLKPAAATPDRIAEFWEALPERH